MIRFKFDSTGAKDFPTLHPELRDVLLRFDRDSVERGLPDPVLTELVRTPDGNAAIYFRFFKKLQDALDPVNPHAGQIDLEDDGTFRALNASEVATANLVRDMSDAQLLEKAGQRFTWHFCRCAVDLRTRHYSPTQLAWVRSWVGVWCPAPMWEVLFHDVTAPHLHLARRDFSWRTRFQNPPTTNS